MTSAIEKEACGDDKTLRCQVVRLYQGGQYKLYKYRKYSDVRLVFSPGFQAAFFGGDPDNFNFPRYDLDSAFLRLYENGKPALTPDHLVWNAAPPKDGDPVFVAGNPGGTDRQLTVDQLEMQRDLTIPQTLLVNMAELRGRLIQFGEASPDTPASSATNCLASRTPTRSIRAAVHLERQGFHGRPTRGGGGPESPVRNAFRRSVERHRGHRSGPARPLRHLPLSGEGSNASDLHTPMRA